MEIGKVCQIISYIPIWKLQETSPSMLIMSQACSDLTNAARLTQGRIP